MFNTTQWTLVAAAGGASSEALAELCRAYWFPVYAYVRRRGHAAHAAEDLTQAFFARLLEKNDLATADRARGRFRTFLLTSCQHFLANEHARAGALKRGGGRIALDFDSAERRYAFEPASPEDAPEKAFDRRWALDLLSTALEGVRAEYAGSGRGMLFDELKPCLTGEAASSAEAAARLGMTDGAAKVALHRLRQRYKERLRELIAATVADAGDVDDEVRDLFAALG